MGRIRKRFVRGLDRLVLEQLQSELLSQHDVTHSEPTFGHKAQHAHAYTPAVELLNVHLVSVANAIACPGAATYHVKVAMPLVLLTLSRGEIFFEKLDGSVLTIPPPSQAE